MHRTAAVRYLAPLRPDKTGRESCRILVGEDISDESIRCAVVVAVVATGDDRRPFSPGEEHAGIVGEIACAVKFVGPYPCAAAADAQSGGTVTVLVRMIRPSALLHRTGIPRGPDRRKLRVGMKRGGAVVKVAGYVNS